MDTNYIRGPLEDSINIDDEIAKGYSTVEAVEEEQFTKPVIFTQIRQTVTTTDEVVIGHIENYVNTYEYVLVAQKGTLKVEVNPDDSSIGDLKYTADIEGKPDILYILARDKEHELLASKPVIVTINTDLAGVVLDGVAVDIDTYIIDDTLYIRNN